MLRLIPLTTRLILVPLLSLAKAGTKVTVDAGDRHRHSVEAKAGSILRYHFATVGYNIGFGVFFKTKLDDEDEHAVVSIGKVESQMEDVIVRHKFESSLFVLGFVS
jgi:hypothetical protein